MLSAGIPHGPYRNTRYLTEAIVPQLSARGTAIWRSRRASGSLSGFYMGLTTFTAKALPASPKMWVGLSGHAEHQRGVGDENFLGVDALAAAVGEGDVERGGRRGLVHLRSLSEDPTGNHPGTLGSGRRADRVLP
jgi:hypothetical protein